MAIVEIENQSLTGAFDSVEVPENCRRVVVQSRGDLPISVAPSLWLSARFPSTIGYGTGTNVSSWADKSANGWDAVQETGNNQPTCVTSAINGRPAILFDGNDNYLNCGDHELTGSNTAITIFIVSQTADESVKQVVFSKACGNKYEYFYLTNGLAATYFAVSEDAVGFTDASWNPVAGDIGTAHIRTGWWSGGSEPKIYYNGILKGTAASAITDTTVNNAEIIVGALTNVAQTSYRFFFYGYIGEVIAFPSALSMADRRLVEKYLAYNWGLAWNI